jgi:hypothetical protein
MSDVQTQLPVKLTDNTYTVGITSGNALIVDGSGVTQPVSGTVTATPNGTFTVDGTVTVGNFPATQTIIGTVTAQPDGTYTVIGAGAAGTPDTGVITVQGINGATPIPVELNNNSFKRRGTKSFSQVSAGNSAIQVVATNSSRASLLIFNAGTETVFLGKTSAVTTADGIPLYPLSNLEDTDSYDSWYAITASSTTDLRIVETAI